MSESSAGEGVPARVLQSAGKATVNAARRWAWANPAVPIGVAGVALAGYVVHRLGGDRRLATALDSTVVTAGNVLDPDPAADPSLRHPVRSVRHAVIHRLTRGAVARRGAATEPEHPPS